jgi:predicted regulator of Ras-like GTPase activity (Roadblock/LC7/MglB family)
VVDDIRRLSDEIARNPASLAFLQLGELLRRRRDLDGASAVATRGRDRNPALAASHDLVARIAADRGDLAMAEESWRVALKCSADHPGAHKGLGFLAYRDGRLRDAEDHLAQAAVANPRDATASSALAKVRAQLQPAADAPAAATPRPRGPAIFKDVPDEMHAVLLVDRDGLILADGGSGGDAERSAEIGAHLTGVSDEAGRAMRHLDLGDWTGLIIEAPSAAAALAPVGEEMIVLVAAPRSVPLGLVRRQVARSAEDARQWLAS